MTILGNHIGGERVASASGQHGPVYNPATGKETETGQLRLERRSGPRGRRGARRVS